MLKKFVAWITGRSLENPNVSLTDPDAWEDAGMGGSSAAGVRINRQSALTLSTLWRAVNLISGSIGRVKLLTYEQEGKGWERSPQHPAYRLLRRNFMPEMTARTGKMTLTAHALMHGAGYAYIVRDNAGTPLELWPLLPEDTSPVFVNGELYYTTLIDGERRVLLPQDTLCIMGLSHDGFTPYSLFDKARESLGLAVAQEKYASKFFSNNAEPRVVVQVPAGVVWNEKAQREFLAQWNTMHQGLESSHKTAILTGGATVNPFSINARDAQLLESRKFTPREVANWTGIPSHKLGDDSKTAYASLEQENQSFLDDCLEVWFTAWEDECESKLLTNDEQASESAKIEFLRRQLVRAPLLDRMKAYNFGVNARIIKPNEAREEEGWNPYEGGDDIILPKNMNDPGGDPANSGPDGADNPPLRAIPEGAIAAHRVAVVDALRRALKRLGSQASRAATKSDKFLDWLDGCEAAQRGMVEELLRPSLAAAASLGDEPDKTSAIVERLFAGLREALLTASECRPNELVASVARATAEYEAAACQSLADEVMQLPGLEELE